MEVANVQYKEHEMTSVHSPGHSTIPGTKLSLTPRLNAKKFCSWGNKEGAVNAFRRLANEGLGEVEEIKGKRGTKVVSELHGPA